MQQHAADIQKREHVYAEGVSELRTRYGKAVARGDTAEKRASNYRARLAAAHDFLSQRGNLLSKVDKAHLLNYLSVEEKVNAPTDKA